ncbi:DUF1565 domain-containing protein [Flavobacterium rhamnosiphilum]|uniref:DUF1565 domain-containing protein n=1 Tax=Flavobacterium rhamnosiphilum TaxID=2541724 RepID=A0A4R5FBA2_9FLAO|nr:glycosyl hydrolase family 28 protein [Flavobacterium rhamnosiphilum]TDE45896.1 DUF1565 domain-containing protein [Flavobacterium rhamnosiphilum]
MNIKNNALLFLLLFTSFSMFAKDYKASLFGINSDGKTLNTTSIQFAINHINANGGGRLVFNVGRYLTGTINLKSNVTLHFDEGAILLGSTNPFDYEKTSASWCYALVVAYDQENIGITGKGILDGQGVEVARNVVENIEKGLTKDSYKYGRPSEGNRPMLVYFKRCKDIKIIDITYKNSASWNQTYDLCKNLTIDGITVDNTTYWNQDGIDIVDCDNVSITNSYIDAADDGICLKSHDANSFCNNIFISNNKIRTSANGIKFGTASKGGFRNVKIVNNIVFDTYRSAIALESVDGGFLENIEIDSLKVYNTGNLIYLTTGERIKGKKSTLKNIKISNVYAEIPATKPDAGYGFEGPIEDQPRNISPAIIIKGLPESIISDVVFKNFVIKHAGGGNAKFANVPLNQIESIPELPAQYPEFSMFKELPAWGAYIRHASGIQFSNIKMQTDKNDFRVPVVLDDVQKSKFSDLKINGKFKNQDVFQNKSTENQVK